MPRKLHAALAGVGMWVLALVTAILWGRHAPTSDSPLLLIVFASGVLGGGIVELLATSGQRPSRTSVILLSGFALGGLVGFTRNGDRGGLILFWMSVGAVVGQVGVWLWSRRRAG